MKDCVKVTTAVFFASFGFQTNVEFMPEHVTLEIKNVLSAELGKEVLIRNGLELPCSSALILPNALYVTYWFAKQIDSATHAIRLHRSPPVEATPHAKEHFFFQIYSCPIQGGEDVPDSILKCESSILRYQFEVIV